MPLKDHDSACGMCGEVLDCWADHALSCCCGGDRVLRHNAIRNVVRSAVAEFSSILALSWILASAPPLQLAVDAAPRRSPGMCPGSPRPGFSVSSLLRTSHISSATPSVAVVFHEVETRKRTFQDTACHLLSARLGGVRARVVPGLAGGGCLDLLRVPRFAWRLRGHASGNQPQDCTAHQLHPSPGKRACNPQAAPRGGEWLNWVGDQVGSYW